MRRKRNILLYEFICREVRPSLAQFFGSLAVSATGE
jgi:hypothetical protein